ncbi:MAG: bifunctional UDP-N-acetylglucosamine diphosphorylase/glucosamine-1-phosphate N-acetyltransferase GlmU [Anaerolineales bacterium]
MTDSLTAVILAAGKGTRMKSSLPKILHPICGQPILSYALQAVRALTETPPVVVVGHGAQQVRESFASGEVLFVEQAEQLGTAHAVLQAERLLNGKSDLVLVTYGDMPLLRGETLQKLVAAQQNNPGAFSMLTVFHDNPRGFGRVLRGADGAVTAIVEEAAASPEQLAIRELNVGAYCFRADWLWQALHRIQVSPKGEFYLTDAVALAVQDGLPVRALLMDDFGETIGINNRVHLAEAEAAMRRRINEQHMLNGVTFISPETSYVEAGVRLGQDVVVWPNSFLLGNTSVGAASVIGPDSHIRDCQIGERCKIFKSVLEGALVENDVDMGPFARLRKGAHLGSHVHMGNFGEVKDSYLAEGVKMGHFSYIGNATIGANTNIGAGTITCNFDGEKKHPTLIGENVFLGSDTMLVAPLTLGDGARTGAGSVVTKNVAENTLVVGVPARAIKKLAPSR